MISKQLHDAFRHWLATGQFDYFVTLTVPTHSLSAWASRDRLKLWDMRMNRSVIGVRWQHRPDERLFMFAALEKPDTNLHWHVLVRVPGDGLDEEKRSRQMQRFVENARPQWRRLVRSGTIHVQRIYDEGVNKYLAKELRGEIQYGSFVLPDEFRAR